MVKKPKKPKPPFMGCYKKFYDTSAGFGSPEEWQSAFKARMGLEAARETLGDKDPFSILGLLRGATWKEIQKAARMLIMRFHPDRNVGDEEAVKQFKIVQAAYETLEARFKV